MSIGDLIPGLNLLEREANHSPPYTAEVKNTRSEPPFSHTSSWRDAYLSTQTTLLLPLLGY